MRPTLLLAASLAVLSPRAPAQGSDACSSAQPIAGDGLFLFRNDLATTDGLPHPACDAGGTDQIERDVWFEWTATVTGEVVVTCCDQSHVDTRLAAYSDVGTCPPSAAIACDDDACSLQSRIDFPVASGESYLLRVGTKPGATPGQGYLRILQTTSGAPQNDACWNAEPISGTGVFGFDLDGATTDGLPDALCEHDGTGQIENDVWFTWTPSATGPVTVRTCGLTAVDTRLAVYGGSQCPPSNLRDCDDDSCGAQSSVSFVGALGSSYRIRLGVAPGAPTGAGQLEVIAGGSACDAPSVGPDLTLGDLTGIVHWGAVGGVSGYSIGSDACNVGDEVVVWVGGAAEHPVMAQNLYRLVDGRFEQIGQSWLKHGFASANTEICCVCRYPGSNQLLGVGCSDPYDGSLNGTQQLLGPRWEVDPQTGSFPYPFSTQGMTGNALYKRIQVSNDDLDPARNSGALYFAEGQYVAADDALAGNGANNASYRRAAVGPFSSGGWSMQLVGPTVPQSPAIRAWADAVPGVEIVEVPVPADGIFLVGDSCTDNGDGTWSYEYAVANFDVARAGRAFRVPVPAGVSVRAVGFHDVDGHSGDPFSSEDWASAVLPGFVEWATEEHARDPRANALRWGTLYNFRFVADAPPVASAAELELFLPGSPSSIDVPVRAPGPICLVASYCTGAPNSQGPGATISAAGSTSVSAGDLVLRSTGGVPGELGLFYYGPQEVRVPFGEGFRCVGAGGTGTFRLNPPLAMDGSGESELALDFAAPPAGSGPGALLPGGTWKFQHWYRDPAGGGAGFNLSDALSVRFCR